MTTFGKVLSAILVIGAIAGSAPAKTFVGRDSDGYRYTFSNSGGKSWSESINGKLRGDSKEVERTSDYIELQLNGEPSERTRLYANKFYMWSEKHGRWIYMGTGRWAD